MQVSIGIPMSSPSPISLQTVHLVLTDHSSRRTVSRLLQDHGYDVAEYDDREEFGGTSEEPRSGCIVMSADQAGIDASAIPGRSGALLPVIYISSTDDVRASVDAMKSGAVDFLLEPVDHHALLRAVAVAMELERKERDSWLARHEVSSCAKRLTPRERQVFEAVTNGLMNKIIAYDLGISEIMVKVHRGRVMRKMNSRTLPDLVRKYDILQKMLAEVREPRTLALN